MLAGNILILFERDDCYDMAQELFVRSGRAREALQMRKDLKHWDEAMRLAKEADPSQLDDICREHAAVLEMRGEHDAALEMFSRGAVLGPVRDGARTRQSRYRAMRDSRRRRAPREADGARVAERLSSTRVRGDSRDDKSAHGRGGAVPESRGIREGGEHLRRRQGFPPRETNHGEGIFAEVASPVRARQGERGETRRSGGGVRTRTGFRQRRPPAPAAPERPGARFFPGSNVAVDGGGGAAASHAGRRATSEARSSFSSSRGTARRRSRSRRRTTKWHTTRTRSGKTGRRRSIAGSRRISSRKGAREGGGRARHARRARRRRSRVPQDRRGVRRPRHRRRRGGPERRRHRHHRGLPLRDADGVPKDHTYLFKLRLALRDYDAAARTSVLVAKQEQEMGNYKIAHAQLFETHKELTAEGSARPRS